GKGRHLDQQGPHYRAKAHATQRSDSGSCMDLDSESDKGHDTDTTDYNSDRPRARHRCKHRRQQKGKPHAPKGKDMTRSNVDESNYSDCSTTDPDDDTDDGISSGDDDDDYADGTRLLINRIKDQWQRSALSG